MAERICCLERTCPLWRIKYSRSANSLLESSIFSSLRQAWRERRSILRSSVCICAEAGCLERRVSAHACQQLLEHERLGQVVVGPGVEGPHLVAGVIAGREHQDREVRAPEADAPEYLAAVQPWQRDIEEDEVHGFFHGQPRPVLPVVRADDSVAVGVQTAFQEARDRGFVFDDQDQHLKLSLPDRKYNPSRYDRSRCLSEIREPSHHAPPGPPCRR